MAGVRHWTESELIASIDAFPTEADARLGLHRTGITLTLVVIPQGGSRLMLMSSYERDCRPRILYAEDDVDVGLFVTEMLRDEGFEVTSVENGDDAADTLENERFHLLLTDVRMPGAKDGIDLAIHAGQHAPELPIVMVSGYASGLDARLQALGKRITFISKPFRFSELSAAIHSALAA